MPVGRWSKLGTAALAALLGAGCGETNIQAIVRLQPAYAAHRDQLEAIVRALPPPGSIGNEARFPESMAPPAAFFEREQNDPRATAEILEVEALSGQGAPLTLSIRSPVHFCLDWTGPNNPLSPSVHGDRTGLGVECEAALRRPWLVLLRTVEARLPEHLRVEGFVVHVPTRRLVASFPLEVQGKKVPGAHREPREAFFLALEYELFHMLQRLPGGRFEMDRPSDARGFLPVAVPGSMIPKKAPLQVPEEPPPNDPPSQEM